MRLHRSQCLSNRCHFSWRSRGLCYANPPFPQLAKVLTKIALERGRIVLCTLHLGIAREHANWRRLMDGMMVGRTELPIGPTYIPKDFEETMPAPNCSSFLSIVDGSLNPVLVSDLDQEVVKDLMAEN